MKHSPLFLIGFCLLILSTGCSLIPETRAVDEIHNPFPQLKRVAVLPFFNQSGEPTLDVQMVAEKYYAALQAVPGFEVLPIGVAQNQWRQYTMLHGEPRSGEQFQQLARMMGVEAIVVGSVTDFQSYYPPRMAMTVHWYSANDGFHEIPAGYGLPWGTEQEKLIPRRIAREAEFELARSQLATQSPVSSLEIAPASHEHAVGMSAPVARTPRLHPVKQATEASRDPFSRDDDAFPEKLVSHEPVMAYSPPGNGHQPIVDKQGYEESMAGDWVGKMEPPMPDAWPDPTDLIPDPPSAMPPPTIVNRSPVLSHTRIYRGDDSYFTGRLADYVEGGDDARGNGWQGYLKRSDDFVHFCCHLHITEMLESRGGRDQSEFIVRWPLSRY